jgi:hypothetical protein
MRVHANVARLLIHNRNEWMTPCCSQPALLVKPTVSKKNAFFRHRSHSNCPFANVIEYNDGLHWDIISYIIDLLKHMGRWRRSLWCFKGLSLIDKVSLWNPRFPRQEFIVHNREHTIKKRIDLLLRKVALEIQCSAISENEVTLRQNIYHQNGFKISWVIGLSDGTLSNEELTMPYEASNRIQIKMKSLIKQKKKFITQISRYKLMVNGIKLKHWQFYLLKTQKILGIFFQGILHPSWRIITLYAHVPKIQFEAACKKVHFLILLQSL